MTTRDQKAQERHVLKNVLGVLRLQLSEPPEEGETPDFVAIIDGVRTGIEITSFQSGDVTSDGVGRRRSEAEWEILEETAQEFAKSRSHLEGLCIGLFFIGAVPTRREHLSFLQEISDFIKAGHEGEDFGRYHFKTRLMQRYLEEITISPEKYSHWFSKFQSGWVSPPDDTLKSIITAKAAKRYRPTDELWLVVHSGYRISEVMSVREGIADFYAVAGLEEALEHSPFARVLVSVHGPAFEWSRSDGWRKLAD